MKRSLLPLLAAALLGAARLPATVQPYGDASTVYATGVTASADLPRLFCSGSTSGKALGDLHTQALAAMNSLAGTLRAAGLGLGDVVFVRAFLAPDAAGQVDYAGWNAAWNEVFNHPSFPWKPARTTVAVPRLGAPGSVIEIEYVCAGGSPARVASGSAQLGLPVTNARLAPYGTKEARIYQAMGVQPGTDLYFASGVAAPLADAQANPLSRAARGDMHTQAVATLRQIAANLATVGLSFQDVVYVRAYVAPDTFQNGKVDLDGWNQAYGEFFNTSAHPHKPARTTVPIPGFGGSTIQLEVEVIAAFPGRPAFFTAPDPGNAALKTFGKPDAQIASGVAVRGSAPLYFSAGTVPTAKGDMKTQALSALAALKLRLAAAGLGFKDVIYLHAYAVPEADGQFDRAGWTAAYLTCFGSPDQPHKPARTTIAVTALTKPDYKIELDVIAAKP